MTGTLRQGEPSPKEAEGGKGTHHSSPITLRQVLSVPVIIGATLAAWAYLETKFDTLADAVHKNAVKLAVLENKVENIEGGIRRIEKHIVPGSIGMMDLSP